MRPLIIVACVAALSLTAACNKRSATILGGGAAGGLTAKALGADDEWVVVTALAGAGIGTLVAKNSKTGDCAYARGGGRYYRDRCRR